jgi:NodT family efflux transporter outer membrane factor (OMF) lipoprotein
LSDRSSPLPHRAAPGRWAYQLAWLLFGVAAACSPHSVENDPKPPLSLPGQFSQGGEQAAAGPPERWWEDFRDPELNRLVDQSLAGNFDLRGGWARLSQAVAVADQAGAPLWPTLDANLGASYRLSQFGPIGTRPAYGFSGSLGASYELDIWKKLSSGKKAAALTRDAAADQVQALAMTLVASLAEAWFDLRTVRARRDILQRQLETNERFLEIERVRFSHGLSSVLDVNQQEQQIVRTRALLALIESSEGVTLHQLAVLLGQVPGLLKAEAAHALPELPSLPATGIPSELLQRRPDVRAAQRLVEAADYRIAVAVADRYPSVKLSADVSATPNNFNDWAFSPLFGLAAGLTQPILDGGRRRAEVDRQRAIMAERVSDFGRALLGAMREVEDALWLERAQRVHIEQLQRQYELARLSLEEARNRYSQGLEDFLRVLTALRSQEELELGLLDARRKLLSHRIQLCRALGGTWATELVAPDAEAESSAPSAAPKAEDPS